MKKVVVISLGGSLIVPEKMDSAFLIRFVKTLRKHYRTHKFVIVCGGGAIARKYISTLRKKGKSKKELAEAGIRATRMNAQFVMQLFGKEANDALPTTMRQITSSLERNNVVICGALRFEKNSTSDSTAAKLASFLKTEFINMTNVSGLFTKDPKKNKNVKLIPLISWKDFQKIALKIKFKPGQNFVLDQTAAKLIKKHKIKTYIIGRDLRNIFKILKGKKFRGTLING